ncbi:MAG: hypothetical protein AAF957_14615 [Planctomycetota bacterium]
MNLSILRRERTVREARWGALFAATFSALALWAFRGVARTTATIGDAQAEVALIGRGDGSDHVLDASAVYLILVALAIQGFGIVSARFGFGPRVQPVERMLPMPTRSVVLQRMAGTWIGLMAPLVGGALVWALALRSAEEAALLGLVVLRGATALTFAVALLFAYRPRVVRPSALTLGSLVIVGIAVVVGMGVADSFAVDVAVAVAAAALVATVWTRLAGWTPVDDPAIGQPERRATSSRSLADVFGPTRWALLRSTVLRPAVLFILVLGGAFFAVVGNESAVFALWLPALVIDGALRLGLSTLHGTDGLPLPRRRVLAYASLPSLLVLTAAAGVRSLQEPQAPPFARVSPIVRIDGASDDTLVAEFDYEDHVRVPAHLWRFAGSPAEAIVVAPWGETAEMIPHPVFWGASTCVYNPYDVRSTSSGRFLAWQVARALNDVHGADVTPEAVRARWLPSLDLEACIGGQHIREADAEDWGIAAPAHPGIPNRFGFGAFLVALAWLAIGAFTLRRNVPSRSGATWDRLMRHQAAPMVLVFALVILAQFMWTTDRALLSVLAAQLHLALDAALGSSPWAWAILVLGVQGVGLAYLTRRVDRIEVPPLPTNGWTKKEVAIW